MPGTEPFWTAGKCFLLLQELWPNFWGESSECWAPVTPGPGRGGFLPLLASRPTKVSHSWGSCITSSSPPSAPNAPLRLKTQGDGGERSCPGCPRGAPGAVRGEEGARPTGLRARGVWSPTGPCSTSSPSQGGASTRKASLCPPQNKKQQKKNTKRRTGLIQRPQRLRHLLEGGSSFLAWLKTQRRSKRGREEHGAFRSVLPAAHPAPTGAQIAAPGA